MPEKIRILYVDDYDLDRELVRDVLEKEHGGFHLTEAASKAEFEALLNSREFDLVLSDFNIAGFEGLEVMEMVHSKDPTLPVVIVTGTGSEEIAAETLKRGASDYVIKRRHHIGKLPATIRNALEKKRLQAERLSLEKEILEREHYYRSLLYTLHEDIMVIDPDYTITDINNTFLVTTGRTRDKVVGRKCYEISHGFSGPCDHMGETCLLHEVFRTKLPASCIHAHQRADGSTVWVDILLSPLKDNDGRVTHVVEAVRDITELKRSERLLEHSEERLKLALESVNDAVWDWRVDTGEVYFSPRWYEMLGYEPYELPQEFETWRKLLHPEDLPVAEQIVFRHLEAGKPFEIEFRMRTKAGGWCWILARGKTVQTDADGKPIRMLGTHVDISERKQTEEELKKSKSFLDMLLDTIPIPVFYKDRQGRYTGFNKAFEAFFGKSKKQLIGKSVFDINPPDLARIYHAKDKELMESGGVQQYESRVKNAGGELRDVIFNKAAIREDTGSVSGLIGAILDITGRKKLQTQLQQAQRMEAIGTLAGGIAHDFNNILASIIGFTELALDEVEPGTLMEDNLQEVHAAGRRAQDLVKQILTISRRDEKEIRPLQLAPLVKEALKMLRATIPTSITFRENIRGEPLVVNADPTQLHQVIVNLVTNAKHAIAGETGVLEVGVEAVTLEDDTKAIYPDLPPGKYGRISVGDTGSGIAEKHLDKIFEPYFTTKSKGEGTGLGLSVVHGIVKSHQGHITVTSQVGQGTTFQVYLPLIQKAAADIPERSAEPLPSGTERVLLVDDEPQIVKMQRQSLERLGYMVTARTSSIEALAVFRDAPDTFDLVITDMTMPDMTGDQLASAVKATRPNMPVILCTGFSEKINGDYENPDVDGILMKPVEKEEMARTVRDVLDN